MRIQSSTLSDCILGGKDTCKAALAAPPAAQYRAFLKVTIILIILWRKTNEYLLVFPGHFSTHEKSAFACCSAFMKLISSHVDAAQCRIVLLTAARTADSSTACQYLTMRAAAARPRREARMGGGRPGRERLLLRLPLLLPALLPPCSASLSSSTRATVGGRPPRGAFLRREDAAGTPLAAAVPLGLVAFLALQQTGTAIAPADT